MVCGHGGKFLEWDVSEVIIVDGKVIVGDLF